MQKDRLNIALALLYFILSTVITAWFIETKYALYTSQNQMMLSGAIAGAKWAIQILAGLFFLEKAKYKFIRRIGFVCFIGSVMLMSVYLLEFFTANVAEQFIIALSLSVATMLFLYYRAVKKTRLNDKWYVGWIGCLSIAVSLQLTTVFHII